MVSPIIHKQFSLADGNFHLLWFSSSNSWIQLEEPAWIVYRLSKSGLSELQIASKISHKYHLEEKASLNFISEIASEIRKLELPTFQPEKLLPAEAFPSPGSFYSTHTYKFRNQIIEISYGTRKLEYLIHPSFAHLEKKTSGKTSLSIETFLHEQQTVLKLPGKAWIDYDANHIKRKIFIEITEFLYNKPNDKWLTFVHGSAVSNGKECIILSTACGSGKSTLAALLCAEGFNFVSDDFIPIDARFCKVYPFPAALSVKDGAFPVLTPLFSHLQDAVTYHFKGTNKTLKYLPFPDNGNFYKPLPVRNLVFVQYDPDMPFSFRKVPTLEAIRRFNEEAWLSPAPANARKFIKWFPGIDCYELVYSDNKIAISEISRLFGMTNRKDSGNEFY